MNLLQYLLLFDVWFFGYEACWILAPWQGIEPRLPALEGEVLTTGPPGKTFEVPFLTVLLTEIKKIYMICAQCWQMSRERHFLIPLFFFSFFFFYFWWILSYIEMKQPWVYMCSPSRSPLPPPFPPAPSRFSQYTRSERLSHASNLAWWSVSP